jgi:hydrogenase-1 operon protein HyaF|tara:strand:+ start:3855 stop:4277 length:423 start_codon:yes stop_codon:yes gene_type:complete
MSESQMPAAADPLVSTGNVQPLLCEVHYALKRLLEGDEEYTIDLRRIPLSSADEDQLEKILGVGEITAELDLMGPSRIWETRYSGVWQVAHFNALDEVTGKYLLVSRCPEILKSQIPDIECALVGLESLLAREGSIVNEA